MDMYLQNRILVRPRVYELLREAAARPLCTVTAGTGYGKTKTVASFLQSRNSRHVWIQLTSMDNYTPRFWEICTHATASVDEGIARSMRRIGFPATPELLYKFERLLHEALANGPELYIVLDDFHQIEEPAIVRLVEGLADADIQNLHIFLLSRRPVPLDYFSLYNNGLLDRVAEEDLRFTYEEIEAYYRLLGFDFSPRVLANVYESTEGWPMALFLVGLHEANQKAHKKDPISFTMPFLNSLFEVEVFAAYPPEVQKVFVELSLLAAVPLDLVKTIAGDEFASVYKALQTNMFTTYNPSLDNQFVFHRLFRRFLKPRSDALPAARRKAVYRLMADWYLARERYSEALDFYDRAGDFEGQWTVMRHYAKQGYESQVARHCIALAEKFPPEFVAKNLMVVIHKAYMYLNLGLVDESINTLEAVLASATGEESDTTRRLVGEAWLALAPVRMFKKSWEFVECFENAARLLPEGSENIDKNNHYLGNRNALLLFNNQAGALDEMTRQLVEIWPKASATMNGCGSGMEHLALAENTFYRGRFENALRHAHAALYNAAENGQRDIVCSAYLWLIRIHFAMGEYTKVMQYLGGMEAYMKTVGEAHAWGVDGLAKAWFYQRVGDFEAIPEWAYGEPLDLDSLNVVAVSREKVVETDCLIRRGEYGQALDRLDRLIEVFREQGAIFTELKAMMHKAICLLRLGREEEAVTAFLHVCQAAVPNDIRITLVEEGEDTAALIALLRRRGVDRPLLAWLEQIETQAQIYAKNQEAIRRAYTADRGEKPA